MILNLAGCQASLPGAVMDESNTQSGEGASNATSKENEAQFNTYLSSDPTSLDISLRSDVYSSYIISDTMEGLVRLEDNNGEYVMAPGDAQSWESNEDGTVWTFHLGDNKWSDGKEVTADQYVYSLVRSADPATGCPNNWFLTPILNYDAVSKGEMTPDELGVKALDSKTLEITLSTATPAFLQMCNGSVYFPQRQDKVEEWGEKYGTEAEYTVYNGPFTLESWTHNSQLVLKKNENYWDKDSVALDSVVYNIMPDISTQVNAFKSGDIDSIGVSTQEWLAEFKNDDEYVYNNYTTQTISFTFYNTDDELMSNKNIRKALTLAIDREDINDMCFGGLRIPTYGWVVPTISVGEQSFREAAGDPILEMKSIMAAKGETPRDILIEGMEELGLGSDPADLEVTLSLAGTGDWYRTFGEYLQQVYLTELGITLKIDFSEWGVFYENVQNENYQIALMSWGAYYNDPYDVLSVFYSEWDQAETGWGNKNMMSF